jgi:1-piperideine-2-carboxylate/1-pyrroline-2-carboxylate reductase [NAD(P)H]
MTMTTPVLLDAAATALRLPWRTLVEELAGVLHDPAVQVPARLVQPLPGGGSLFVMPALDGAVAITKLISFTPANMGTARATIQGDVVVFDIASGERRLLLDGPTVTARRTAAVSLLAAQRLAPAAEGPLLVVGAGAQGRSHLEALATGLPIRQVLVASRTQASAHMLAEFGRGLGLDVEVVDDADAALDRCPLVVTCTPARGIVLRSRPRDDAFIAAVGAFTPQMAELGPGLCTHFARHGRIVVDTPDAVHEAGDLIQAGIDVAGCETLAGVVRSDLSAGKRPGPVLFKSCGWAGWDLAAARCALRSA